MRNIVLKITVLSALLWIALAPANSTAAPIAAHEIQVVDSITGRGVPLVEMQTVNRITFLTDSAGRVAFSEPDLMNTSVFFTLTSHGYEFAKDFFGYPGVAVNTTAGGKTVLRIKRINVAERLYRTTGTGVYRDSVLLGKPVPTQQPLLNAKVAGQDSTQRALYNGKIYWFWGDTQQPSYPLGNFRTTGATSETVANGGLLPSLGINLNYFKDSSGFTKQMCPFKPTDGVIWIDGLLTFPDQSGKEQMATHFSRRLSLEDQVEHGIAIWNDGKNEFQRWIPLALTNTWQYPHGHTTPVSDASGNWLYFADPYPTVRVKADAASVANPAAYEAWSCLQDGSSSNPNTARMLRDASGKLTFRWTTKAPPCGLVEQQSFQKAGLIATSEYTMFPGDVETGKRIDLKGGSIAWNAWRQRWVIIGTQQFGTSLLGEVWYAESRNLTGPWTKARKIVTHTAYDFYNPIHHSFFDEAGGKLIYFEGTYTNTFAGGTKFTPRYEYNQIMYRLDLSDPRIQAAWVE